MKRQLNSDTQKRKVGVNVKLKKNSAAYWKREAQLQYEVACFWRAAVIKMSEAVERHGYKILPRLKK